MRPVDLLKYPVIDCSFFPIFETRLADCLSINSLTDRDPK